jgi:hypothetical protein
MKVERVRYERIRNLGNYENEKISLDAVVDDDETAEDVYRKLRREAFRYLGLRERKVTVIEEED